MSGASEVPAIPEDVRRIAMDAEVDIRNEVDHPTDIIARAILAFHSALGEWQDISTAPRDGSLILLGRFVDDEVQVASGHWNLYPKPGEDGINGFNGWLDKAPTHWKPITPPRALANPENGRG